MAIYLLQALKGERLSSVFSPDGTLISASAAPHCGAVMKGRRKRRKKRNKNKKKGEGSKGNGVAVL